MTKKIQVSFSQKQIELLEKLKGELGESDSEVVRNVVLAWLSEKGFLSAAIRHRMEQEIKSK